MMPFVFALFALSTALAGVMVYGVYRSPGARGALKPVLIANRENPKK